MKLKKILLSAFILLLIPSISNSVTTNYKTFTDGQVLTAGELNSLQQNYTDADNAILDGDTFTGDMLWHSSSDIKLFSDTGSNLIASIDGGNGKIIGAPQKIGTYNLTLNYSAGTLKIQCGGSDCSATNPGYVVMSSNTLGNLVTLKVTSSPSFNDDAHASSDITGGEFGAESGEVWDEDRPFFIYAINTDDTDSGLEFAISPRPNMTSVPSDTNLFGKKGTPATSQSDFTVWFWTSDTVTGFGNAEAQLIGLIEMKMSTADDWTVQALDNQVGIGVFGNQSIVYTYPDDQMGAANNTFLKNNGGSAPEFTTNQYKYKIGLDGMIDVSINLDGDAGADGSGAVTSEVSIPYKSDMDIDEIIAGSVQVEGAGITNAGMFVRINNGFTHFTILKSDLTSVTNAAFTNGARSIVTQFRYKAF